MIERLLEFHWSDELENVFQKRLKNKFVRPIYFQAVAEPGEHTKSDLP